MSGVEPLRAKPNDPQAGWACIIWSADIVGCFEPSGSPITESPADEAHE